MMKTSLRRLFAKSCAALLVLSLIAAACGSDGGGDDATGGDGETVQLVAVNGSSEDFIALVSVAAWEILAEDGIEVEQRFLEEASTAIQAVTRGDAQIATNIGVNVGVPAVDAGADIVDVVATQRPTWALAVEPSIESFADLEGKRLAVHGEASFTRAVSQYFSQLHGFQYEELIIPGSEVRAEALAQEQIDASVIDLPDIVQLSKTYPGSFKVLSTIGEEFPDLIEQDIWLDRAWAEENPELATKVVSAIVQAMRKLTSDSDYALGLAEQRLPDMDRDVLEELVNEYADRGLWPADGLLTPERALSTLTFFNDVGEIEIDVPTDEAGLDKYFDFSYLDAALTELDG